MLLSVGIPTIAVLVGILLNNRQIDALRSEMRSEINSLRSEFNSRFETLNIRITQLDTRIDFLEKTMNARFDAAHEALLRVEGVMDARLKHLEERG